MMLRRLTDALGRTASVAYPDSSSETFSYSGLRTTTIDRTSHKKVQENDAFSRLIQAGHKFGFIDEIAA